MGKPAARLGDSTGHGGVIMAGAPTVLIGGAPAARMGDMHVCPMMNPGTPPPPHVGQQIIMGSPTVLICGQMAARVGDPVMCSGPPDSIVAGCPTVLIGESATASAGAMTSAAKAGGGVKGEEVEGHFLDVTFIDKAGLPIKGIDYKIKSPSGDETMGTLSGPIKKNGIQQGNYEIQLRAIVGVRWSKKEARDGEKVKLVAQLVGFDPNTKVTIEIFEKNYNKADFLIKTETNLTLKGDKVEMDWIYEYPLRDDDIVSTGKRERYSAPVYYFRVKALGVCARSNFLLYRDWIEIELKDKDGKPRGNEEYIMYLSNGEIRKGKLDGNGYKREEKVPPVQHRVEFPNVETSVRTK
jgi:uncharacterized Zn-binding protein involved in type VI secretion